MAYFGTPSIVNYGAGAAAAGGASQGMHLGGMLGQTMGALARENQSRVAQAREGRRMQHESNMLGQQQNAILMRIQQERELAEKRMRMEFLLQQMESDRARGVRSSTRWTREYNKLFGE